MNSNTAFAGMDMKTKLSTLWIFILLNMIFRDLHELGRPGFLAEVMTGTVNGIQMTEALLLLGGIMAEIPIAMVLLSRILKYSVNRWTNIVVGVITILLVLSNGLADLDDMFFMTIEVVAMSFIVWYAWKWPNPRLRSNHTI